MHRLQDEIILIVGPELFDECASGRLRPQAILQQLRGVRAPLAEIVVDVNRGNARLARSLLQAGRAEALSAGPGAGCVFPSGNSK